MSEDGGAGAAMEGETRKHTPGPWKWDAEIEAENKFRALEGRDGADVLRLDDVYPGYAPSAAVIWFLRPGELTPS